MGPSRVGRAERIIQRFIYLKQPQDRYGMIVFNWTSVVLSYLTTDPQSILLYFDYLNHQDMPEPGTNVGSVLTNATRLVTAEQDVDPEAAQKRRVIFVLLSDGDDTAGGVGKRLGRPHLFGVKVSARRVGAGERVLAPPGMGGGVGGVIG